MTAKDLHVPLRGSIPVTTGFRLNQGDGRRPRHPAALTRQVSLALKLDHIGLPVSAYLDRTMLVDIKDGEWKWMAR